MLQEISECLHSMLYGYNESKSVEWNYKKKLHQRSSDLDLFFFIFETYFIRLYFKELV